MEHFKVLCSTYIAADEKVQTGGRLLEEHVDRKYWLYPTYAEI